MKSVMFSEIAHASRAAGLLGSLSPLAVYCVSAAVAMPLLVLALRSYGPGVPLAAIVLPLLACLALPLCAGAPGRLEIRTRFDACHLRQALDGALTALGYVRVIGEPNGAPYGEQNRLRYVRTAPASWRARAQSIHVQVSAHSLDVIGPIPTLRALQASLAGAVAVPAPLGGSPSVPASSALETVAGAMQISDNAERVAGMAE